MVLNINVLSSPSVKRKKPVAWINTPLPKFQYQSGRHHRRAKRNRNEGKGGEGGRARRGGARQAGKTQQKSNKPADQSKQDPAKKQQDQEAKPDAKPGKQTTKILELMIVLSVSFNIGPRALPL